MSADGEKNNFRNRAMNYLSREQVRKIDHLALERYHIPGVILMENAARSVVDVALEMLGGDCSGDVRCSRQRFCASDGYCE